MLVDNNSAAALHVANGDEVTSPMRRSGQRPPTGALQWAIDGA